jgi:hypothetical protein
MLECEDEDWDGGRYASSRSPASSFFQCKTPNVQYFPSTSSSLSSSVGEGKPRHEPFHDSQSSSPVSSGRHDRAEGEEDGELARNDHSFNCLEAINAAWVMNYGVLVPSHGSGPYAASPAGLLRVHNPPSASLNPKKPSWGVGGNQGSPPSSLGWGTYWIHD